MNKHLLKLPENRTRRNYLGGAGLDMFKGKSACIDGDRPEEWLASTVAASNPGLEPVPDEGLTFVDDAKGGHIRLDRLFESAPEFYLGAAHVARRGAKTGFLAKLLDSAIRLHVQAHPTRAFANARMNCPWGKLECYHILGVRPGFEPYIRLGFQKPVGRDEWRRIIETQDLAAMDACFERVKVLPGETWHVPGGLPHAIGEGLLMLEIMEPSDLVVRCEFEREGLVVPPQARFMGRDLEFSLDIFDYTPRSVEEVTRRYRREPVILDQGEGFTLLQLSDPRWTDSFLVEKLLLQGGKEMPYHQQGGFSLCLVSQGAAEIRAEGKMASLLRGECCFAAAATGELHFRSLHPGVTEICLIRPG